MNADLSLIRVHPRSSALAFNTPASVNFAKSPRNRNGMLVAQRRAIAFVPTKLGRGRQKEEEEMLWTIFVILLVLWLLGVVSSYTVGGFIHILLVLALVVLLINIIGGRRTVI
jgi:hypothetical protein